MFQTIKLAKLRLSPINVRTVEDKALGIEPLAADITARGVLQNLLVTPVSKPRGMFEVFDGGRRLRALMLMVERGTIVAEDYDVPVMLLKADNNALSETSLAANFHQLKLTPAEECRAFQHFLGKDGDIDAVASRFGQMLVVAARDNHQWLACDCLADEAAPPLMSPAYLSIAETYYLRRLTSSRLDRPEHHETCPFHRPQAPGRLRETGLGDMREIGHPDGLFNAHRLAPEKLAQMPADAEPDDRSRGVAIPRLARLLWLLLERGGLDVIPPLPATGSERPSIKDQFAALGRAAKNLEIAPGVPLTEHLYFHPRALLSNRIYANLRRSREQWPAGYAPQAFLVTYASKIHGETITTADGGIEIRNRIQYATMDEAGVGGPYLTITVIGEHSKAEGYRALRAYAQPIHAGNRFLGVHSAEERAAVEQLISLQYTLRRHHVILTAKKPLFDMLTTRGPIRPDLLASALDHETGEEREWAIQVISDSRSPYALMKEAERKTLETLGQVIVLTREALGAKALEATILADLGRA